MRAPSPHPGLARLSCERGDITRLAVDAIGNAANRELAGGGGVDGAIHLAAGAGLAEELARRHPAGCPTGECRITGAHSLPAKFILHCVGPVWRGGSEGEAKKLAGCYRVAMEQAERAGARSVAFPAISAGIYGYPQRASAEVALVTLAEELAARPGLESVRMILFSDELLTIYVAVLDELFSTMSAP